MIVSLSGPAFATMEKSLGYGQASYNIYKSLQALGVEVGINLPKADIELCFSHPMEHVFNDPDSYKIAYSAWESTDLHFHWKKNMLRGDEIWGTSDWVSDVWKILFPTKTIFTYKHGINSDWKPKLRTSRQKQFTFLHIGEPFSRKDAQLVTDCFIELYGNNSDYRLVMKANGMNTVKVPHPEYGYLSSPSACYDNIITIDSFLTDEQMVGLYEQCDVFIYPSWGEGWGLQPMQALASGMPVISTDGWADYSKYITWAVKSNWLNSPWQDIHPGMMMKPNKTSLLEAMKNADEQYDSILKDTFKNAFKMHAEYDWLEVTKPAVARLREIYAKRVLEGKNLKA